MATSEGIPSSIDIEFLELNDNPYLKELIEKSDLAKGLNQHNSIISISASPKHPLQPQELETLQRLLSRSVNEPQFCLKADDTLGEDIRIDFAFYSM